jgi:hypothetical protein
MVILTGDLRTSKGFGLSVVVVGVVTRLSPLRFREAETESWLPSRCRPILPSLLAMATKLVRTLERGLGDSASTPESWH